MQDEDTWRLGSLGEKVCGGCYWWLLWLCCCVWYCTGELGGESAFLSSVTKGPRVVRVRVRFGIAIRLLARKTLDMGGWEGVWYAFDCCCGLLRWGRYVSVGLGVWFG